MPSGLGSLALVAVVAALAPVLAGYLRGWIPQVVLLLLAGIAIGPEGAAWAVPADLELFSEVGLGLLFLLAGYELDLRVFRERVGRLAVTGWVVSVAISAAVVGLLYAVDIVDDYAVAAIALTTTALGTLLPILREHDMLGGRFGRTFFAAGAVGEIAPILAIALFLGTSGSLTELVLLFVFAGLAYLAVLAPRTFSGSRAARIVGAGQHATAQTTLRLTFALLIVLLFAAAEFGFDVVLGAFVAGLVVRRWAPGDVGSLESKLDAVAHGVFIPVFFVYSGMVLDVDAVVDTPLAPLVILVALLVVRGAPALVLYRRDLPMIERLQLTFLTATALPLLVALTSIGLSSGTMEPSGAASLVTAGVLSVLCFPLAAVVLRRRSAAGSTEQSGAPGATGAALAARRDELDL